MNIDWRFKSFNELTAIELYEIMRLRSEVFVVEQDCVYLDADRKDEASFHFAGWDAKNLVAYCRILPPGLAYDMPSIGRVVTSPLYRKTGSGRKMMELAIQKTNVQFGTREITIGAQLYLKEFYGSLGFSQVGGPYIEDGIPHIKMHWA
jgi:ElaA protein